MNITKFVNQAGCFDLQFRRDIKHKRTGTPTYYSWKAQFVIAGSPDKENLLKQIQNTLGCGQLHYITGAQLRYSVQAINELHDIIVPFFEKYQLAGKKRRDVELWSEAIKILYQNKGNKLNQWSKESFLRLMEIQKSMQKYKTRKTPTSKWLPIAEAILEHLE